MSLSKEKEKALESSIVKGRNTLTADRLDMSFGEIISMYTNGELIIRPGFQRLFRWSTEQKTRFIESMLLGIPIPSIFVAEDNNSGKWELVDGLQRVSTVLSFFGQLKESDFPELEENLIEDSDLLIEEDESDDFSESKNNISRSLNNWRMTEGKIIKELEGVSCDDLPSKFFLNLKRVPCRVEIIKWDSKYDMRYELFDRLNTGGSLLTQQELRNCVFRATSPELTIEINKLANNPILRKLVNPSKKKLVELYLDELVLRFYSLLPPSNEVNENLSSYMTKFMERSSENPELYHGKKDKFVRTLEILDKLEDVNIFKTKANQFSTSLYDGVMIGIGSYLDYYSSVEFSEILERIQFLKKDDQFKAAMGTASNYKNRVKKRVERAIEIFKP